MKKVFLWSGAILTALVFITLGAAPSGANPLDLTSVPSSGQINGAIFTTPTSIVSGTGLIDPFLRINPGGGPNEEQGYNTNAAPQFDEDASWTKALQLSEIQDNIVVIGGTPYYEFVLDVNESSGGTSPLIDVNGLQLFLTSDPTLTGYDTATKTFPAGATKIYDLDQLADERIQLNYANWPGSGRLDMFALFPTSIFGNDLTKYVVLYSSFLDPPGVSDGFEEWAHKLEGTFTPPADGELPEPATLLLIGTGLVGIAAGYRRKF